MKKLLLLLSLIAITYLLEVAARDLVKVGANDQGASFYVWKDSINRKRNIVWWRSETVFYDANGNLTIHGIADNSGDCNLMNRRIQKFYDQITGEIENIPTKLFSCPPESICLSMLEYVCSQK